MLSVHRSVPPPTQNAVLGAWCFVYDSSTCDNAYPYDHEGAAYIYCNSKLPSYTQCTDSPEYEDVRMPHARTLCTATRRAASPHCTFPSGSRSMEAVSPGRGSYAPSRTGT